MISSSERFGAVMAGRIAQPTTAGLTRYAIGLHPARITGSAAALRRYPVDVLGGILDVTGFAMHAVLRIDPQLRPAGDFLDFIHTRRTIPRLGAGVDLVIDRDRLRRIEQLQMRRLVFLMVGVADEHRTQ